MSAAKMVADSTQAEITEAGDARKRKKKIKKGGKNKVVLPEDEDSDLDLKRDLRPIGDFIKDRAAMIREMFRAVRGASLDRALPDLLKSIPLEELEQLCQEQLEVMSKKRIRRILAGEESANISSSGTEDDTSDEEVAARGDQSSQDLPTEDAATDRRPADSTSLNQDSPRPPQEGASSEDQLKQQQQQQQPHGKSGTAGGSQPPLPPLPLPVPIDKVKQERIDPDEDRYGGVKQAAQGGPAAQSQPQRPAKNYRRQQGASRSSSRSKSRSSRSRTSRSSSRSRSASRSSSRSSRSSRSYSSSRDSYSSDNGRRKKRRGGKRSRGSSKRDRRRRRRAGGSSRRRHDGSSEDERYGGGRGRGGPQHQQMAGYQGVGGARGVPQPQAPVHARVPDEDEEDVEMYTSGSEDGELVKRELVPGIPPGVKIKTEPPSDTEIQEQKAHLPQSQQNESIQQQTTIQPQPQEADQQQQQSSMETDQQNQSNTQRLEQPQEQQQQQQQEEKTEVKEEDNKTDEREAADPGVNLPEVKDDSTKMVGGEQKGDDIAEGTSTDKLAEGVKDVTDNSGEQEEEDDDEEDEEDDEEEDMESSALTEEGKEEEEEEGEGKGEKEMDKMELLELEMRARAIKAMLCSQGEDNQPENIPQ